MCGITGFWNPLQHFNQDQLKAIAKQMSQTMFHRGPDDDGTWTDAEAGIALGHRRLSILDLSPEGHQPMLSADGRYVMAFNGEIYNFLDLQKQLKQKGHHFRGHSDTEVMLASFSQWGVETAIKQFNGMFAFALWDRQERTLYLGRDRLGEKPLYYGSVGKTLLFGSELKALKAHPDFCTTINRDALALYLRHHHIPTPYTIYTGIYKLPPASLLKISSPQEIPQPLPYWSARIAAETGLNQPFTGSEQEAIAQLDALLRDAVSLRMIADVPLGAFLSGGIDSSTVVALMQAQSNQPVKTFSIGFYEDGYNEAQHAKAVAQHLGTDHTELYVTPQEAMAVIPKLPTLYDEPFADSSQIPTFLVSQLARQKVSVSLSGDGGDELFCGYHRYFLARNIWQKIGWMPHNMRQILASALSSISPQTWNLGFSPVQNLFPKQLSSINLGDKINKLAEILAFANSQVFYQRLMSHWKDTESLVIKSSEPPTIFNDLSKINQLRDFTHQMMYLDTVSYLPNDILVKVDRASMGVSLESRIPLLDHRVVEFAWQVPLSLKVRNGQGKWLLRQVLYQYIPPSLIERPKMGFGVPIDNWLRGSLRDWAEELLDEKRLCQEGFFNPQPIRQKWEEHLSGTRNWQYYLWDVIMFQAWLQKNG
ncbi:MAG TPA: asparagine synthase (glutamine-hydrolyzing) [Cyanothece sp. UBA12306]|nr:asparagine synthase (glutamine-hydrolyzing) [Cyanothece sp. UBA12306]